MTAQPAVTTNDVHQALRLWHEPNDDTSPLDYLYLYKQSLHHTARNPRQATNEVLLKALQSMETDYASQEADLLRRRFLELTAMYLVANQLNIAEATAHRKQRQAIENLTEILRRLEQQAQATYLIALENRLKLPTSIFLVGAEEALSELYNLVNAPNSAWLISVEGLGGIGKTALANALVRRIAPTTRFYDVAWVSAKQQDFVPAIGLQPTNRPALDVDTLVDALLEQFGDESARAGSPQDKLVRLTQTLKERPYLVVVDNLETVADYQTLLPTLINLTNPSKFLLTSRSMQAHSDVSRFRLKELSKADTFAFLKHEAETRRLSALANATEPHLEQIYEVVGGNPLALKLVVGQIYALPLAQVLDNLRQATGKRTEALYTFIYRQAWQNLDAAARQLLLTMPLAQNGTLDRLAALSELPIDDLSPALEQLLALSLLESSGNLDHRRYHIHRLTETFLLNEVIKWQTPS